MEQSQIQMYTVLYNFQGGIGMFDLMPFGFRDNGLMKSFDDFEKHFFREMNHSMAAFRTDIEDKGDHYMLEAELPGFKKEDIHVQVEDGYLTIHAEHTEEVNETEKKNFVRKERYYGSYERSFSVNGIHADAITGEYKNGVLKLSLPKAEPVKPAPKQIDIL